MTEQRQRRMGLSGSAGRGKAMRRLGASLVVGGLATLPVVGHHAFTAEFDPKEPVSLRGEVVRMEWINPHTWIHLSVDEPAEAAGTWKVEGGPPNTLYRRGFTKSSLLPGTVILVEGYRAKDGSMTANGREVTFEDGRSLFLGSSGTGAPSDGADPADPQRD